MYPDLNTMYLRSVQQFVYCDNVILYLCEKINRAFGWHAKLPVIHLLAVVQWIS